MKEKLYNMIQIKIKWMRREVWCLHGPQPVLCCEVILVRIEDQLSYSPVVSSTVPASSSTTSWLCQTVGCVCVCVFCDVCVTVAGPGVHLRAELSLELQVINDRRREPLLLLRLSVMFCITTWSSLSRCDFASCSFSSGCWSMRINVKVIYA